MTRKRLNKNLIVSLTLCMFVMIIVLSVLMLQQLKRRDPKYFVELAQQYENQQDWQTAAVFYQKAWERSNDPRHLVSIGDALLNAGEVGPAVQSWRMALINQPDLTEAHIRQLELLLELARLYGRANNWKAVKEAVETFLQSDSEKTTSQEAFVHNAIGLALLNLARQGEGSAEQGEAALRTAAELAPDVVEYALELANHHLRPDGPNEDKNKGESLFGELLERYALPGADAAKVRLAYARHLAEAGNFDEAEAYFEESLALAENEPAVEKDVKLGYAVFLSQQWARAVRSAEGGADRSGGPASALFEKAEAILKECIEADPDDYDPYLRLAVLYGSARRHRDVVDICEARVQRGLSRKGVKAGYNRLSTFNLFVYASEACLTEAVAALAVDDEDGRQQWLARAQQYVTDAKGELPSHPRGLAQAGRVKLTRGLDRQALEDLRAADEAYRQYDTAIRPMQFYWDNKMTLARVHLRLTESGAAKAVLEEVLDQARRQRGGDVRFWTLYARVLFQNNELNRALVILDGILETDPNNPVVLRLKAAVVSFRAVEAARQFVLEENSEAAAAVLHDALKKDPADPGLVREAVREMLNLDRWDDARSVVQEALAVKPDDVQLQTWAVLTREGLSPEMREQALLEMINAQEDDYQKTLELIGFYVRKKDFEKTLPLLDRALEHLTSKDTPLAQKATIGQHRALLATKLSVAAALDDADALTTARDDAAAFNVDGAGGKSLLGQYHMQRREYDLAIKAFRQAIDLQPTDARSLTQLGQCLQLVERTDEAQSFYQRAIHANPHEGQAYKGLAMLAKARGDTEAYEKALQTCERLMATDPWVRAELLARRERADPQAAIADREKLLANDPDNLDNLERLAALYVLVGDITKADGYYARLLELHPEDARLVAAVSQYYRRTSRPERSLALVTRYAESRPNMTEKANARLLIAHNHLSQGDIDRAEAALLAAADIAETFEVVQSLAEFYLRNADRPDKALRWWDKAVKMLSGAHSPRLPRVLANRISCLLHRSLNDTETARRYVDELLVDYPDYPQGLLLKSEIHTRMGEIQEAVHSLTDYLRQNHDDPNARYERALLQWARGRLGVVVEDLEAIKHSHPLIIEPRLLLARLRQQTGRSDLATRELESLFSDAKDASDSVQARALQELVRAYIHEERLTDAERIVTTRINRTRTNPEARWFFLRGRIAFERGDDEKALADVQRGAQIGGYVAEGVINVLDMYLRVGRPADGIKYYEQYAPIRPGGPSSALVSRYARLLAAANRKQESVEQFRRAMSLAVLEVPTAERTVTADLRAAFPDNDTIAEAIGLFDPPQADPQASMARVNDRILVRLYQMAERYDEAAARLNRLIETSRDDRERGELLHELGDMYHVAGRFQDSRRAYEQALKFSSDNWITLNNLAYLLSDKLAEFELARPYADRCVALADTPDTRDTLGWIYVGLGEYRLAIAQLSRAIRLDPTDALPYYHLGEAYLRGGQPDEAANIFRAGRDLAAEADNHELIARFDASLERVARQE